MEFYVGVFPALLLLNAALYLHLRQRNTNHDSTSSEGLLGDNDRQAISNFKWRYFAPYAFVVMADWLQGPYLYALYKNEKGLSESTVAALFSTGFISAGISASFVGSLADSFGRKQACLIYCLTYSASCLSVLSNDQTMLFAGRILGGISTTLQYSVFESWMVTEYHSRQLSKSLQLGELFSFSVVLSNVMAIIAGVVGEALVSYSGTKTMPFLSAVVCLGVAFFLINSLWVENFGETKGERASPSGGSRLQALLADKRLLALCATTTIFEGSMYLFVFFWSPALINTRAQDGQAPPPPFGLIFSNFMCAMMLGSQLFSLFRPGSAREASNLLLGTLGVSSWSFLIPVLSKSEAVTFGAFALFEMCAGMYFPTMSQLKSEIVGDSVRAKVYSLMRLPLNVFVVAALSLTHEGGAYRANVFTFIGALSLVGFGIVRWHLA